MRTPKNPNDARLAITKKKITHALNQNLIENPSISNRNFDVYYRAGVGQSTFFDHFRNLDEVMNLQKETIRKEFKERLSKNLPKDSPYSKIFTFIAVFIMQHRDFYEAMSRCQNYQPFEEIICLSREHLTSTWPHLKPDTENHLFILFTFGLESTFREWANQKLDARISEKVIHALTSFALSFENNIHFIIPLVKNHLQSSGQPDVDKPKPQN